ncbi:MAG: hypothetical protein KDA60_09375 [Planctomycetales bacterium]|nr:hypothetical protein [Planctomycetales bacterium]
MLARRRFLLHVLIGGFILSHGTAVLGQSVGYPVLPETPFDYRGYAVDDLPEHFRTRGFRSVTATENTPTNNPITNAGATLGRVLFYDRRLSHNNSTACASCHQQETGFSDANQFSTGADGDQTPRHSMALGNAKFYDSGKFFWDERAATLEHQILMPIQDPTEMGMSLDVLRAKLGETSFYPQLFQAAFGSPEITDDRIARSVSQFVRSMVSYNSKFDSAHDENGAPHFEEVFTDQEILGGQIFHGDGRCTFCHTTNAQVGDLPHNTGLDALTADPGAGDGRFKVPSLRNVEVREFYMHDGRFDSLEQVVDFYSTGIQDHPQLDFILREQPGASPIRFEFTAEESSALVAFLKTLTDWTFLSDPKFADPFVLPCDFNNNLSCNIDDLNSLLTQGPLVEGVAVSLENQMFDIDGDSMLTWADAEKWLAIAAESNGLSSPYVPGDANLDGAVDAADMLMWSDAMFSLTTDWNQGDFNGDGLVDGRDFNQWLIHRRAAPDTAAVPEPTAAILLIVVVLGMGTVARRTPSTLAGFDLTETQRHGGV